MIDAEPARIYTCNVGKSSGRVANCPIDLANDTQCNELQDPKTAFIVAFG
jgi:hypothetical protein